MEILSAIQECGGRPVSVVCDNCPMNQALYSDLGCPGAVCLLPGNGEVFLVYYYVHIFKNLRNNWITEEHQELQFTDSSADYIARWRDLKHLYEEDKLTPVRLTKLTNTAIFLKVLQCQSVPLVCQVFNGKTSAVLHTLMSKLTINEGTVRFVTLVTKWFTILNVKDKLSVLRLRDEYRAP